MNFLRKFRSLNPGERSLLVRTVFVVAFLRVALCLVPFVWLKEYMARRAVRHPMGQDVPVERVVWAVRTAAAYVPRATCLTQALAAKYQLERSGRSGRIHIGVDKKDGQFLAHAWLECEGQTVIGGGIVERYTRLVAVD